MIGILKQFWDIPTALAAYLLIMAVPENNLTDDFQNAFYLVGNMFMAVALSFEGFQRWSRFAISRNHPVMNYVGNMVTAVTPFLVVLLSPLFLPVVITLHVISHWRSPDPEGAHLSLIHHGLQFMVFLTGFVIYLTH